MKAPTAPRGLAVGEPRGVGAKARVVDELRPAERREQPLRHRLGPGRQRDVLAVARRVDVARRLDHERLPSRGCLPVTGIPRPWAEHREDRLDQREVDHWPLPSAPRPRAERSARLSRRRARRRRRPSRTPAAPARGRQSRSSRRSPRTPRPACRSPAGAPGPVCPQPETRTMTSLGLRPSSTSGPSPIFSSVPGR